MSSFDGAEINILLGKNWAILQIHKILTDYGLDAFKALSRPQIQRSKSHN